MIADPPHGDSSETAETGVSVYVAKEPCWLQSPRDYMVSFLVVWIKIYITVWLCSPNGLTLSEHSIVC